MTEAGWETLGTIVYEPVWQNCYLLATRECRMPVPAEVAKYSGRRIRCRGPIDCSGELFDVFQGIFTSNCCACGRQPVEVHPADARELWPEVTHVGSLLIAVCLVHTD